ncbi:hypothetical protein [Mesorhizobium sp. P5_C1]
MAGNENGCLGGMMVSYPFRDIEPSTVNDCFGSGHDYAHVDVNVRFSISAASKLPVCFRPIAVIPNLPSDEAAMCLSGGFRRDGGAPFN